MYKITIKGKSRPSLDNGEDDFIDNLSQAQLKELDGIDCQDEFTEYFSDDENVLTEKGVTNGYMNFKLEDDTLYTIVKYSSREELSVEELDMLKSYTSGQLSDGIGEGFEQMPCRSTEDGDYYISPWYGGQKLEIVQES